LAKYSEIRTARKQSNQATGVKCFWHLLFCGETGDHCGTPGFQCTAFRCRLPAPEGWGSWWQRWPYTHPHSSHTGMMVVGFMCRAHREASGGGAKSRRMYPFSSLASPRFTPHSPVPETVHRSVTHARCPLPLPLATPQLSPPNPPSHRMLRPRASLGAEGEPRPGPVLHRHPALPCPALDVPLYFLPSRLIFVFFFHLDVFLPTACVQNLRKSRVFFPSSRYINSQPTSIPSSHLNSICTFCFLVFQSFCQDLFIYLFASPQQYIIYGLCPSL